MSFRPWGLLDWTLALDKARKWSFLGALGTEDRSLETLRLLRKLNALKGTRLVEINNIQSRHSERALENLKKRRDEFRLIGGNEKDIKSFNLLDPLHKILELGREVESNESSVLFDITSLPKRFFFPLMRNLVKSEKIKDFIVTYTIPERYTDEPLSENCNAWAHLPGFAGYPEDKELLIVGVGFMVESLQQHLSEIIKHESIQMLIPFPSSLRSVRRAWEAVYHLESNRKESKFADYRVDAIDMSSAFDRILSLTNKSTVKPAFAPFGPKPISAAMCLFASQQESAVYYPQPNIYHPNYSHGVRKFEQKSGVFAYWIKNEGINLYQLSK